MSAWRGLGATLALAVAGCVAPQEAERIPPAHQVADRGGLRYAPRETANFNYHFEGRIEQGGLVLGSAEPGASLLLDGKPVSIAADGRFLIAFDRDAAPSAKLEMRTRNAIDDQLLSVAPRAWQIESLPTLPKGTTPTPEFLARRAEELKQITAARTVDSHSEGWRQHFMWPVQGRISGVFGSQRIYAGEPGAYHPGVDIARPAGTPVVAPADGVVILAAAAPFTLEGNLLMIDHGMGLNSAFLHLSRIDVKVGDAVRQGQPVGAIGMTGRATGPHLHWAMKWRDVRLDPAPVAGPMPTQ